jgi:peptide/nickel transport system substrate-binding protein
MAAASEERGTKPGLGNDDAGLSRRALLVNAGGLVIGGTVLGSLLGCGGGGSGGGTPATAAARGGTLRYAFELGQIPPLDPAMGISSTARQVCLPMFEGLVMEDYSEAKELSPIIPRLATEVTPSDGGRSWQFTLREGVKFHDGTAFDVDAAIWNLERIYVPKAKHYDAEAAGASALYFPGPITALEKLGPSKFAMRLPSPFPANHQMFFVWMVSPTAYEQKGKKGFATSPVGTGPFKFDKLNPGVSVEMVPNPDYWGEAPKLDRLIMRPISDPLARAAALRAGEVDMAVELSADTIDALRGAGVQVHTGLRSHTWHFMFNMKQKPYTDKRVRQAINYAINREQIAEDILRGTAYPMLGVADKGSPYSDDSLPPYDFDPEKAKSLLAAAGLGSGFKTTWWTATNGSGELAPVPMSEFIQSNLRDVGIDVTLKKFDFSGEFFEPFVKGIRPDVGAYQSSYSSNTPFWWVSFSKDGIPPGSTGLNTGFYDNPEVTKLYRKAIASTSEDESVTAIREMQKIIWDDAPWLFVVHGNNIRATTKKVQGFIDAAAWNFSFDTISVA